MNSTKKRILPAQYALATSGANAGNIGWINFGEEFTILNNQGPISVVNKLKNGYFVSFDIYLNVTTESTIIDEVGYISSVIPTYSDAPFGNTAYTSIGGYSALMLNSNWPISDVIHTTITIENIAVKDCCLNPVKNFTFYVADAETTNKGVTSEAEVWTVQTTPNIWNMVEHMQNVSGTDEGPTISGVGTNTFIEQGIETSNKVTSAYVVSTITPRSKLVFFFTAPTSIDFRELVKDLVRE